MTGPNVLYFVILKMSCGIEIVKTVIVVGSARPMLKVVHTVKPNSRGFHKYTTLAIMPKLASEALLRENKKIQ